MEGIVVAGAAAGAKRVAEHVADRVFKRGKGGAGSSSDDVVQNDPFGRRGIVYNTQRLGGRYRAKRSKQLLLKAIQAQNSAIFRWQSLQKFDPQQGDITGTYYPGSHGLDTYVDPQGSSSLPVYAFGISDVPLAGNVFGTDKWIHAPFYRLYKDNISNQYEWQAIIGKNNSAAGNVDQKYWQLETPDTDREGSVNRPEVIHNWVDARVLIHSPCQAEARVHVLLVQFAEGVGPDRHYYDVNSSVDRTYDTYNNATSTLGMYMAQRNEFWDRYLATKCVNPIRPIGTPNLHRGMKILRHKVYNFDSTSDGGTSGSYESVVHKLFAEFHEFRNYATVVDTHSGDLSFRVPNFTAYSKSQAFNPMMQNGRGLYVLIVGESYNISGTAAVTETKVDPNGKYFPSFDIMVRSKWTKPALDRII